MAPSENFNFQKTFATLDNGSMLPVTSYFIMPCGITTAFAGTRDLKIEPG